LRRLGTRCGPCMAMMRFDAVTVSTPAEVTYRGFLLRPRRTVIAAELLNGDFATPMTGIFP